MATIMDGRPVAQQILARGAERVQAIVARTGVQPCLATVLVGDDPASVTYARMKRNRCESVGMRSVKVELPTASTTAEVVEAVAALGRDAAIHGIPRPAPGAPPRRRAHRLRVDPGREGRGRADPCQLRRG